MPVLCQCPRWKGPRAGIPIAVRRYASGAAPPKRRVWVRLTVVTLAAAGIGAYVRSRQEPLDAHLNPVSFARYKLVSREPVSSTNSIFTVEPASPADNRETYELAWQTGVWSVMFKQPQLQIGRDYTPLPPPHEESDGTNHSLRFLIRRDPHGEVSRYLHRLQQGSQIEMRGPQVECEISPDVNDILFIAGGTGIAPALQAAYIMLKRTIEGESPKIHILWANRKREDCAGGISDTPKTAPPKSSWWPLRNQTTSSAASVPAPYSLAPSSANQGAIVRELQDLKTRHPGQITVDYFVDEENTFISTKDIKAYIESVQSTSANKRMIVVSGPEGFINYMAGPKVWAQGYELQGPVKGIIQQLGLKEWEIWKL
jgi:homoaconitate hydratase